MTTALETEIKALHPYDTPEFIRLPVGHKFNLEYKVEDELKHCPLCQITAGSKEYLDWIHRSAKPE